MDSKKVQKYLSYAIKTLFTLLGLLMILSVISIESNKKSPEEIAKILEDSQEMRVILASGGRLNDDLPDPWPPKMNNPYPEIELLDQDGQEINLSRFKGRIIVLEFIDVSSPVSQAQSGAGVLGSYFASVTAEIDKYAQPFSQVLRENSSQNLVLPHSDVVEIKVIVYGEKGNAGSRDDAQNWADHFNLNKSDNVIVAVTRKDIRGEESSSIIGGYQLIDKNMMLRVDSSGPSPKHSLNMTLVPLMTKLMIR